MDNKNCVKFEQGGLIVKHLIKTKGDLFLNVVTYIEDSSGILKSVRLIDCRVARGVSKLEGCKLKIQHLNDTSVKMLIENYKFK